MGFSSWNNNGSWGHSNTWQNGGWCNALSNWRGKGGGKSSNYHPMPYQNGYQSHNYGGKRQGVFSGMMGEAENFMSEMQSIGEMANMAQRLGSITAN
eukprot:7521841-Karenia_brevis.AAC.1